MQAVYKRTGKGKGSFGMGQSWNGKKDTKVAKVAQMQVRGERTHGRRAVARKEAQGKRKVVREKTAGAAGHAMSEGMFPRVEFERKTSPKRMVNKSET